MYIFNPIENIHKIISSRPIEKNIVITDIRGNFQVGNYYYPCNFVR